MARVYDGTVKNVDSPARPGSPNARIGWCCKFVPPDGDLEVKRLSNTRGTTIRHLSGLSPVAVHEKVVDIVRHNLAAVLGQVRLVARNAAGERLLRLAGDVLPIYGHAVTAHVYGDPDVRGAVETGLAAIGEAAREGDVRLSMHPDQFCVVASTKPGAREAGLRDLEYHCELMAMMGYGSGWHPHGAHVNIHGGAKAVGTDGILEGLRDLSVTASNLVTFENDEFSYGLDDVLRLSDRVPVVLDLHHHWIASRGQWIRADDPRIARIVASWRGTRPVSHVSVSREELFPARLPKGLPVYAHLERRGHGATDMRAHSDTIWNDGVVDLVGEHLRWTDFEVEAKGKNVATADLAGRLRTKAAPRVMA